jgi:predicted kinase
METPELIIFVGLPASGKSTYYHERFGSTHVHVSRDLMLKVRQSESKQLREIGEALAAGKSVVVDNTNPSVESREPLIAMGRRHGARIIAIHFDADVKTALARNRLREGTARVPDVAIFVTRKNLVAPGVEEGFHKVMVIR